MKLYLSSYRIPTPNDLAALLSKPLADTNVALIPNAKDYYAERPRTFKVNDLRAYMEALGLHVEVVDLRDHRDAAALKEQLMGFDLVWAMGGNTYMLRDAMHTSGFDQIVGDVLGAGVVYGGDSAGALVAGLSIAGVEGADEPEFAEHLITDGLGLVPFVLLPHVDNPEFASVLPIFRHTHADKQIIELKDSQAVVFDGNVHRIIEGVQAI